MTIPHNAAYIDHLLTQLDQLSNRYLHSFWAIQHHLDELLAFVLLDLEPLRAELESYYSGRHGGRPPKDPVAMLRSIILMAMKGKTSFNKWVSRMDREPVLAALAGFDPNDRPAIGTYYGFIDRITDGPYRRECTHYQRPSRLRKKAKGKYLRQLKREKVERLERQKAELAELQTTATGAKVKQVMTIMAEHLPKDFLNRIETLLMRSVVVTSAKLGLLGDLSSLVVAGDGTPLDSHASPWGKPACNCRQQGIYRCDCDRWYSDRNATWGWDHHNERYFFGNRLHALVAYSEFAELPIHLMVDTAKEADVLMGVESVGRVLGLFKKYLGQAAIRYGVFDTGYDATPFYRFLVDHGIRPIIPANARTYKPHDGKVERDQDGTPLCSAHIPMRFHGYNQRQQCLVYNCPAKRPGRENGKQLFRHHPEDCPFEVLCDPDSKMGPLVYLPVLDNPRLNGPVPRNSAEWKDQYAKRTCAERVFSWIKERGGLGDSPYRSQDTFLVMALANAIAMHTRSWVKQRWGDRRPEDMSQLIQWLGDLRANAGKEPALACTSG